MDRAASGTAFLAALLLAGCGSTGTTGVTAPAPRWAVSSPTSVPLTCSNAPSELVAAVAAGMTVQRGGLLSDGRVVIVPLDQRSTSGWPTTILAANVAARSGNASRALGSWAVGEPPTYGPIIALNRGAQALTRWGAAAQGSTAAASRDHAAGLDATKAAEKCVSD